MYLEQKAGVVAAIAVECTLVRQLARIDVSLADHIVHLHHIAIELECALRWQAGDFDPRQGVSLRAVVTKSGSIDYIGGVFRRIEGVVCALRAVTRQNQTGNVGEVQHAIGVLCNHIKPQNALTQTQRVNVLDTEAAIGHHFGFGRDFVVLFIANHQR